MHKDMEGIEKDDLYQILDRNISWIGNCDTKASIMLEGIGVVIAIFLSSEYVMEIKKMLDTMASSGAGGIAYIVLGSVALVAIIIGLLSLVRVLLARTNTKEFKERGLKSDSKIFFSSISENKTYKDYKRKLENCSESALREDLIPQIYICSQICTKSLTNIKKA